MCDPGVVMSCHVMSVYVVRAAPFNALVPTISGGALTFSLAQKWFLKFVQSFLLYGFVIKPLTCLMYTVLQLYKTN